MTRREAIEEGTAIARTEQLTVDVCFWQRGQMRFYYWKRSTEPLREGNTHFGSIHCDGRFEKEKH